MTYYLLGFILIPGIILAIIAQIKVENSFRKYSCIGTTKGLPAQDVARAILDANGLQDIKIIRIRGRLTDYYSHRKKVIALSDDVYDNSSIAAVSVACHEVGHAIQYKNNYLPIKIRNLVIPIVNVSNMLLMPLIIISFVLFFINLTNILLIVTLIIFGLSVLLNLITLPVEYNASNRALKAMQSSNILDNEELGGAKQVLNAAALTYVASFILSLLNLIRLLIVFKHNDD